MSENQKENRKEVDYYPEIAEGLRDLLNANFPKEFDFKVYPLIGELKSALNTLVVNQEVKNEVIEKYAREVETLNLDISFFIFNNKNKKYEVVILEIKKVSAVGLTELSQLIGYCLVSKSKFGILVNVDGSTSERFMNILQNDAELTTIERKYRNGWLIHRFGVMKWDSLTLAFEYTNIGSIKSIPDLVDLICLSIQ